MIYAGCDAHKHYSVFAFSDDKGPLGRPVRVEHQRALFRRFLEELPERMSIAVETIGSWYWLIDAMEAAGHNPILTDARKAKARMGQTNKTDKLDAAGLAVLLRNGTLPAVWIPPKELRDQRELPRMRMTLVQMRTKVKNRIQATLAKYALTIDGVSDVFGVKGRVELMERVAELPPHTRFSVEAELKILDQLEGQIEEVEGAIRAVVAETPAIRLLMTLPGVGMILGVVMAMEIGEVERFATAEKLASYAGTVPRVTASGGKIRHGKTRSDVNQYLKWALFEAANVISSHRRRWPDRHVVRLYLRIRERKGHGKAVGAVARHLAEAAYWILRKNETYREPQGSSTSSTREETRPFPREESPEHLIADLTEEDTHAAENANTWIGRTEEGGEKKSK
jgi:transposase